MNELQKIQKDKNLNLSSNSKGTDKGDCKLSSDLYYHKTLLHLKGSEISFKKLINDFR